jgi:hypothetical protein
MGIIHSFFVETQRLHKLSALSQLSLAIKQNHSGNASQADTFRMGFRKPES